MSYASITRSNDRCIRQINDMLSDYNELIFISLIISIINVEEPFEWLYRQNIQGNIKIRNILNMKMAITNTQLI